MVVYAFTNVQLLEMERYNHVVGRVFVFLLFSVGFVYNSVRRRRVLTLLKWDDSVSFC